MCVLLGGGLVWVSGGLVGIGGYVCIYMCIIRGRVRVDECDLVESVGSV